MTLTCGLFPLSTGTEQEGKLPKKRLEVRLDVQDAHKALPQGYRGKEVRVKTMAAPGFSYLPDAGQTIRTLCLGSLADGGGPFLEVFWARILWRCLFVMDEKPVCYDSVPACLCMKCQLFDVQQMVRAKSSLVSSRSPFLPSYAASLLSRPASKSLTSCAVSPALSSRPMCSVAETTCGLADVDALKSACEPVCEPDSLSRVSFLSRPRLDFADVSSSCFLPAVASSPVPSSPPVASRPVVSSPAASSVPPVVGPVPVSSPVLPSRPSSRSFVAPRPVPRFAVPRYVPAPRPVGVSPFRLLSFVPLVLFVFPVLLSTPFGFALSFIPLLR